MEVDDLLLKQTAGRGEKIREDNHGRQKKRRDQKVLTEKWRKIIT